MRRKIYFLFDRLTLNLITVAFLIFAKVTQFFFLPNKYFYDSNAILRYVRFTPSYVDKAYRFTAAFYRAIDVFHFTSIRQWAVLLPFPFFFMYAGMTKRNQKFSVAEMSFFLCNIFLSGVYVFNISKDAIQLCFFFLIYCVIVSKQIQKEEIVWAGVFLILCFEGWVFRNYYFFIAAVFLSFYAVRKKGLIANWSFFQFAAISILSFFLFVFVVRLVSPSTYQSIATARNGVNRWRIGASDAASMIDDLIHIKFPFLNWMLNYLLNGFRMFFPVELLFKHVKYFPFVLYQFLLTWFYSKSYRKCLSENYRFMVSFFLYTSFVLVSIDFEPDFGSWIRHESTLWPIFFLLFFHDTPLSEFTKEQQNTTETKTLRQRTSAPLGGR